MEAPRPLRLSGTDAYVHSTDANFLMIGERTNVAGSPRFRKLIKEGKLEDAVEVAARERDEQLVLAGREAVGASVGIAKRQADLPEQPKDDLDDLLDELDDMEL